MAMWGLKTRLLHRLPRVLFSKLFRDQDQDHEEAPKLKDALQFSGWLWVGGGGGWSNHSQFIAFAILPSHPLLLTGNWRLPNPLKCRIFYYRKESSSFQEVFFTCYYPNKECGKYGVFGPKKMGTLPPLWTNSLAKNDFEISGTPSFPVHLSSILPLVSHTRQAFWVPKCGHTSFIEDSWGRFCYYLRAVPGPHCCMSTRA